uniref:Uncharacterized protein n=1 Tax=Epinephelus coioides TaxID=94232 RepID=G8G930_EPICO|nr:hypothetical protein 26h12 [Epinephelus coioides]
MAKVADTENIVIGDNAGKVGSENAVDVTGGVQQNAALGNTSEIAVLGQNTEKARIGAENAYKIQGGLKSGDSVGNTTKVVVGSNSGSIGSGNRVNIS